MDSIISLCKGLRELALFAGAGGGILGGHLLGWRTVCAVEIETYCHSVLCQRQNEGLLSPFPIWDDVCSFDGKPWRGAVDVVSGGFPCQDISAANIHAEGITGKKSGLWKEMFRIIREVRPRFAFVENSPFLTARGLAVVLGDLAESGYNAEWDVCGANTIGANHERKRIWILAVDRDFSDSKSARWERSKSFCDKFVEARQPSIGSDDFLFPETISKQGQSGRQADTDCERENVESWQNWKRHFVFGADNQRDHSDDTVEPSQKIQGSGLHNPRGNECRGFKSWWQTEPDVGRVVNGLASRVDRLRAIGNGQIPAAAALMFCLLLERMLKNA